MNEYLDGAEADLLKRGQSLLGKIPAKLLPEFRLLAQKCVDQLTSDLDAIQTLRLFPPVHRLRKFKRIVAHIDFLEVNGFAALNRANDDDKFVNVLIDQIVQETNYPLLPPVVTLLSQGYFYIWPQLGLLGIPLGEADSLLHLPDLYHELAHPFEDQQYDPKVQPFRQGLKQGLQAIEDYVALELRQEGSRSPQSYRIYLETWKKSWTESWLVEVFCDLFATYTLGPAFVWSHLHLCVKRGIDPYHMSFYSTTSHPADDARMTLMLCGLNAIGFTTEAQEISDRWQRFLSLEEDRPEPEYYRCYAPSLLKTLSQIALDGVKGMGCRIADPHSTGIMHVTLNEAWKKFWQDPKAYSKWEADTVSQLHTRLISR